MELTLDHPRHPRYDSMRIVIDSIRWGPVTGTTSSLISTFKRLVLSTSDIIVKPVQVFRREALRKNDKAPGSLQEGLPTAGATHWSPWRPVHHYNGHPALEALAGSASGVGGFFKYFFKGMLVEMPLAATEGLRSFPAWYGGEVRDIGKVTGWKSGAVVAGRNLQYGVGDGLTDFVREPLEGSRNEGAIGALKGVGKGSASMLFKVSSGKLPNDPPQSTICKPIRCGRANKGFAEQDFSG